MKIDDINLAIETSQARDEKWRTLFHEVLERGRNFDHQLVHPRRFIHDVVEAMEATLLIHWSQETPRVTEGPSYQHNREGELYRFGLVAGFYAAKQGHTTVHMIRISMNFTGDDCVIYYVGDPQKYWDEAFTGINSWIDKAKAKEIVDA
jgi:hypothetical protein